jgi:hypothetical protein
MGISSADASILIPGDEMSLSPIILNIEKIYDSTGINFLWSRSSETYKKNNNYVCWNDILLKGADPKTFIAFSDFQGMDDHAVYFSSKAFKDADRNSFVFLDLNFSKDNNSVYSFREPIKGADAQSFQLLGNGYYMDKNHIYLFDETVEGANPKNTTYSIGNLYLRSGNFIYRGKGLIVGANADTFELYKDENGYATSYSRDGRHIFYEASEILDADIKSFQFFPTTPYSKDKNNVYCKNQKIPDADIPTFHTNARMDMYFAEDKNNTYLDCKATPKK